ncbi:hypothetical protein [Oceanospirillum sediminis]|nr:hypothetical protein [Oceanospirillum sediminis]
MRTEDIAGKTSMTPQQVARDTVRGLRWKQDEIRSVCHARHTG